MEPMSEQSAFDMKIKTSFEVIATHLDIYKFVIKEIKKCHSYTEKAKRHSQKTSE